MKKLFVLGASLSLAGLAACSSASTAPETDAGSDAAMAMMKTSAPSADTQALWTKTSGYKSWPTFAEDASPKLSSSHMGNYVVTYHNDVVTQAITGKTLPLPDGAIVVKENYMHATDPMPMALTVMSKQSGKWYWVEETPDGRAVVDDPVGKPLEGYDVQMCVGCHSTRSANDDIYTHSFK